MARRAAEGKRGMEWRAEGTVIGRRLHGEHAVILDVLTLEHGRHAGLVPGGASPRRAALTQLGSRLMLHWRGRGEDMLGTFAIEPLHSRAAIMGDPVALAGLQAVGALLVRALPERDPHPRLAQAVEGLLDAMAAQGAQGWAGDYLRFEMLLLDEVGLGLDLDRCAMTGAREGLAWVSPRTGRAVTAAAVAGQPELRARLLSLPAVLGGAGPGGLAEGLALTGHFLHRRLAEAHDGRPLPAARDRLAARLLAAAGGGV